MAISVNAGEKEVKRANFGSKLEQWKAIHESAGASRRSNVATFPRRDVSTSRRWVNQYNSQQAVTSRRRNVATSQRRNVVTSVRDLPSIIKSSKGSEFKWGIGRRTNEGTEFQSSIDTDFEEVPVICIVSYFLDTRMMFLRLNIYIFLFSMF